MLKVSLLAAVIGAFTMNGQALMQTQAQPLAERDTTIIVESDVSIEGLTTEQILNSQRNLVGMIRNYATSNYVVTDHYTILNNAFVMNVNNQDVQAIKNVPGVKSVTVDSIHWKQVFNEDSYYSVKTVASNDVEENISATTMEKPSDSYDGEGTAIAILDNEFYFRGVASDNPTAWNHEVFDDLDESVSVKYTFDNLTSKIKSLPHAKRLTGKQAGEEGSLYFNRKVPYYYDYGGRSLTYSGAGPEDYDVTCKLSYHGSHVASIAAANAPTYKGIAPKAQLVCMKVFTEYKADEIGKQMGFSDSSGAYDTVILKALEDCIALGVDGINMSLGSDLDDFDSNSITLKTLTKLANSGIMTAISAGNAGKSSYSFSGGYGNWTTDMVETGILSSYANNAAVTTVASGQPDRIYYETAIKIKDTNIAYDDQIVNREGLDAEYNKEFRLADLREKIGEVVDYVYVPGFGASADYTGLNVVGKVAVVNRGSLDFSTKYSNAVSERAAGIIIVNNDPTASDFNFRCSFGDGFNPTIPCSLVLYKDKPFFENNPNGSFTFITKDVSDNRDRRTIATYSSDGATFDLDLKPDITTPGDNIRGAVPPQKKEDRELTPLSTYQYLSGTSMAAPNYAGAQSLVLSEVSHDVYQDGTASASETKLVDAYRKTVDMRLMSTAVAMTDRDNNPETNVKSLTSPRMQGAGMVNLDGAINTSVYLEGMDLNGKAIGKSKIALRNNADIAKGDIKLSFIAHNESDEDLSFDATLVVMRPAKIEANLVLSKDYSFSGEVDSLSKISGLSYWDYLNERQETVDGTPKYKEVIKITRVLEYYKSKADYEAGRKVVLQTGYYYNASSSTFDWQPLPNSSYQSVQDVELARISGQKVTAKANSDTTITINPYSLTKEQKDTILSIFEYGCMIEGYVLLDSKNLTQPDLSIPYLGFYSGSDVDASRSYASPAVFEPFNFEKNINKVYPSYLVNDITKSLLGKDNVNFESMWLAGYIENPTDILTDNVLSNDSNFTLLQGFHTVGIDPYTGEKSTDGKIYVGSPEKTNTMIIQQFMLRSVSDNYFTITNKSTQQVVYSSALEDMLFGDQNGKHELYKSHVDGNYLSSGYVAHRAYARVPLYDTTTGEAFKDGDYEVTFNYLLAGTNTWVNKTYEICIDSSSPEIKDISTYYNNKNEQKVKFEFKDRKVSYVVIGNTRLPVEFNATDNTYFVEVDKKFVDDEIGFIGQTRAGQSRLFIKVIDAAYGEMSAIVHFDLNNDNSFNFNSYQMVYGTKLAVNNDFKIKNNTVSFISIDPSGKETNMEVPCTVNYKSRAGTNPVKPASGGCNGSIVDLSITITITSLIALTLLLIVRKKKYERN